MSCASCDDLRRQLREAREEIEAWEAGERGAAAAECDLERLARWKRRLRAAHGTVLALMELADRPGRAVTYERVILATRRAPHANKADAPGPELAKVLVCYARRALARTALRVAIQTERSVGWSMTAEAARALKQAMGDEA